MKKSNLLVNILNIITQLAATLWIVTLKVNKVGILFDMEIIVFLGLIVILNIATIIINIIAGIRNRKNKKSIMILYIITAILFIFQSAILVLRSLYRKIGL